MSRPTLADLEHARDFAIRIANLAATIHAAALCTPPQNIEAELAELQEAIIPAVEAITKARLSSGTAHAEAMKIAGFCLFVLDKENGKIYPNPLAFLASQQHPDYSALAERIKAEHNETLWKIDDLPPVATPSTQPVDESNQDRSEPVNSFVLSGNFYQVKFGSEKVSLTTSKAVEYLHRIISANGRPLSVADLRGDPEQKIRADMRITDTDIVDGKTLASIRERLAEINDVDESIGLTESLEDEKNSLMGALEKASRGMTSPARKAAETMKQQLRDKYKEIAEMGSPILAEHLKAAIKWDGFKVSYLPAKPTEWQT